MLSAVSRADGVREQWRVAWQVQPLMLEPPPRIDEKGTEAAAVTSMGGGGAGGAPPSPRCTFIAIRPFVAVITDRSSGVILFMGIVANPQPGSG